MKKQIGLILILFGFIYNCSGQTKTITEKKEYELQHNSDSTNNLLILKGRRALNIPVTLILDDRDTFMLIGKQISKRFIVYQSDFLLKNIPIGEHKMHISSKKVRKYKDSLNYTFNFQADGTGRTLQQKLPKLRYNNVTQFFRGFAYTIDAALLSLFVVAAQYGRN